MSTFIPPQRHTPDTIGEARVLWLLTIRYGSEILRLSTDDLDIEDADAGEVHHYFGTLPDIQYSEPLQFLEPISEGVSVPIETTIPVSIAELEAEGHRLEGCTAELARWVEGTDYSARRILVEGEVSDPEWGADGEPVSFSIQRVIWEDDVIIPAEGQRVTGKTWSTVLTLDEAELGLYYPIVFGMPGKVSTSIIARGWITGSCGVWVDRTKTNAGFGFFDDLRLVLAGHPVKATRVYLSNDDVPEGERFEVRQGTDLLGQIVSFIDADYAAGGTLITDPDGNDTYALGTNGLDPDFIPNAGTGPNPLFVGWYNDAEDVGGGEGGMLGPDGQVVRSAGDVLETLLRYTSKPVDRGRFVAAKPFLSRFKIDAMIDAQVRPWDWIREHLLPILPISIVTGPSGLYPVVWRFDALPSEAVAHLDAGADPHIMRAGRVRVDSSEIKNSFSLDYAWSVRTGTFYGNARLGPGPYDAGDPEALTSLHCRVSQQRYRYANGLSRIVEEKLESRVIYDTPTANAVLSWRARAYALARRTVDYLAPERDYGWIERGSVVLLSDPELFIESWLCLVLDVQYDDSGMVGLQLLRVEDPARDAHRTG